MSNLGTAGLLFDLVNHKLEKVKKKQNKIQVLTLVFKQKLVMTFSDLMIR